MHTFNSKPINQYIHDMYDVCNQYLKIKFYHEHTPTNQQQGVLYTKSEFLSFYGFNGGVKKWERAMKEPKY